MAKTWTKLNFGNISHKKFYYLKIKVVMKKFGKKNSLKPALKDEGLIFYNLKNILGWASSYSKPNQIF